MMIWLCCFLHCDGQHSVTEEGEEKKNTTKPTLLQREEIIHSGCISYQLLGWKMNSEVERKEIRRREEGHVQVSRV